MATFKKDYLPPSNRRRCVKGRSSYTDSSDLYLSAAVNQDQNSNGFSQNEDSYIDSVRSDDGEEEDITIDLSAFLNDYPLLAQAAFESASENNIASTESSSQFRVTDCKVDPSEIPKAAVTDSLLSVDVNGDTSVGSNIANKNIVRPHAAATFINNTKENCLSPEKMLINITNNEPAQSVTLNGKKTVLSPTKKFSRALGLSNPLNQYKNFMKSKDLNKLNEKVFEKYPIVKCEKLDIENFVKNNEIKIRNWPLLQTESKKSNSPKSYPLIVPKPCSLSNLHRKINQEKLLKKVVPKVPVVLKVKDVSSEESASVLKAKDIVLEAMQNVFSSTQSKKIPVNSIIGSSAFSSILNDNILNGFSENDFEDVSYYNDSFTDSTQEMSPPSKSLPDKVNVVTEDSGLTLKSIKNDIQIDKNKAEISDTCHQFTKDFKRSVSFPDNFSLTEKEALVVEQSNNTSSDPTNDISENVSHQLNEKCEDFSVNSLLLKSNNEDKITVSEEIADLTDASCNNLTTEYCNISLDFGDDLVIPKIEKTTVPVIPEVKEEDVTPKREIKITPGAHSAGQTRKSYPVQASTPSSSHKKNYDPELVCLPFSMGWMREHVIRATGKDKKRKSDIYYFSPEGTKLRSMPDILTYLSKHPHIKLSAVNFTFAKELIYGEPVEIERGVKEPSAKKLCATPTAKKTPSKALISLSDCGKKVAKNKACIKIGDESGACDKKVCMSPKVVLKKITEIPGIHLDSLSNLNTLKLYPGNVLNSEAVPVAGSSKQCHVMLDRLEINNFRN